MKSLLIVGFPRGFTSATYQLSGEMLPFLKETGVSAGEVLNPSRNRELVTGKKVAFYLQADDSDFDAHYAVCSSILKKYAENYIIKDVVQPWIVRRFINENPSLFNVLYVDRPLEHVKFSMERKGWAYKGSLESTRKYFSSLLTLDVEKVLYDPRYFHLTLKNIYSEAIYYDYLDDDFVERRDDFLKAFQCNDWAGELKSMKSLDVFSFSNFSKFEEGLYGAWSLAIRSTITINLSKLSIEPRNIQLKAIAPLNINRQALTVDFYIDGDLFYQYVFKYPQGWVLIDIPLKGLKPSNNQIEVTVVNAELCSPATQGDSKDSRTLGVGVSFIGFSDADNKQVSCETLSYLDNKQSLDDSMLLGIIRRSGLLRKLRRILHPSKYA